DGRPRGEFFSIWATALQVTLEVPAPLARVSIHEVALAAGTHTLHVEAFDGERWHLVAEASAVPASSPREERGVEAPDPITAFSFVAEVPMELGPIHAVRLQAAEVPPGALRAVSSAGEVSLFGR